MQFNVIALTLAAMASVAAAETVTVYACPSSTITTAGIASSTIASTGVVTAATSTGSPIAYATGAASINGVSALGMIVAGGVALFL
ncbi:uncharacterized protein LY89DRAFT_728485 [Mollisia scopiformis]|uniref:Antifreeze protein n=1 Tax=Mollisia scopiformis TaxID=149040 RepID=A0A194XQ59_MOLSC|nr:uncharacterized protein LY89DRAFT_728485 [Mollisia scopiformis]KUJ22328.1 hypothetical protein LY89DRAFT_728485 [Mollisia scopiformis]